MKSGVLLAKVLLIALVVGLRFDASAEAATITINSNADTVADNGVCTLREAVAAANADLASGASVGECAAGSGADTLVTTAALAGATITLSTVGDTTVGPSALRVDSPITLEGGASGLTLSRSGPDMRLFYVAAGSLALRDLTLRNGRVFGFTGGGSQWGGYGGGSAGLGGAIFSDGTVTLERCTLTANEANGGNGGSLVGGGSRGGGGGAGLVGVGSDSPFPIDLSTSDGGAGGPSNGGVGGTPASPPGGAGGTGGGGGGAGLSPVTGNSNGGVGGFGGGGGGGSGLGPNPGGAGGVGGFGGGGGGGGKVEHAGPQGVGGEGGLGGGRGADAPGGGGNVGAPGGGGAGMGGAIFARAGSVTATRSTFQGNIARGGAGGTNLFSAPGSSGRGLGGAIFLFTNAQLTATNCTFSGNSASGGGGGVFNYNGIASLANSTLSGNQAGAGTGGGITNQGDGATADLQLNNTIVANSTGTDVVAASSVGGTSTTGGNGNLIESQSGFAGGITSTADPVLSALANNGGPTQTHAIGITSPALDAGLNAGAPATDQRGRPRVLDGNGDTVATIDIGAYELETADLRITKTDGVTTAVPGQTILIYTLVASNAGPTSVPSATVTDTFPSALSCSWTSVATGGASGNTNGSGNLSNTLNLPVGGSVTYTATCSVNPAATGTLSNTATVASSIPDPLASDNSATDSDTLVPTANLSITKTDGVTTAVPGQTTLIYTLVASNVGPSNSPSSLVTDNFPAPLTCSWTSVAAGGASGNTNSSGNLNDTVNLPVGGSVTYTATCSIDPAATGTLANTATITSAATDPVSANNSATDTDTLVPTADLSITKTDGVTTAAPGQTIVYTLVASNLGPSDAPTSTVIDTFPAPLTCTWTSVAAGGASGNTNGSGNLNDTVNLPVGGSVTYTATCSIDPAATGTLANTATITSAATDPVSANNSATDTDTLVPVADLSITKTDGVTTVVPSAVLTYTLVVTNQGPSVAPNLSVSDTFPSALGSITWTCVATAGSSCTAAGSGNLTDTASLAVGGTLTYTAQATLDAAFFGTIANTATVALAAGVTDPNAANNSATDNTRVSSPAVVSGLKQAAGTFVPGAIVTYTVTLANSSAYAQLDNPGDEMTDVLPSALILLNASADSGSVVTDLANNTVHWNGSIPGGGQVQIVVEAQIQSHVGGATVTNQATIHSDGDGDGTNEVEGVTDDPTASGTSDPTRLRVLGTVEIPTLDTWGVLALGLGLGLLGLRRLRAGIAD